MGHEVVLRLEWCPPPKEWDGWVYCLEVSLERDKAPASARADGGAHSSIPHVDLARKSRRCHRRNSRRAILGAHLGRDRSSPRSLFGSWPSAGSLADKMNHDPILQQPSGPEMAQFLNSPDRLTPRDPRKGRIFVSRATRAQNKLVQYQSPLIRDTPEMYTTISGVNLGWLDFLVSFGLALLRVIRCSALEMAPKIKMGVLDGIRHRLSLPIPAAGTVVKPMLLGCARSLSDTKKGFESRRVS